MGGLVAVLVDCPRRLLAQQPGLIDLVAGLGNCLLHETLVSQWTAERHPSTGPVDHQGQRTFGAAQRAHAVVDAPRPQPGLGDREPGAFFGEQVGDRHPDVVVDDFAVPGLVLITEDRCRAHNGHARRINRHQDHRLLLVASRLGVGAAHHDQDLAARIRRPRRPPLTAVDHVVAAVAHDRGLDVAGVAAGDRRLGHRERRCGSRRSATAPATACAAPRWRTGAGSPCCRCRVPRS